MSGLRLCAPARATIAAGFVHETEPVILSFRTAGERFRGERTRDPLSRARLLHDNRLCPRCRYPIVEPLELADGLHGRNNRVIPGTTTLVGFHCRGCHTEWPT